MVVAADKAWFPVEMAKLIGPPDVITRTLPAITDEDVYAAVEDGVAAKLTEKLRASPALRAEEADLAGYRSEILVDYVYGKKQLAILEDRYSAAFSAVDRRARGTLRRLTHLLSSGPGDGPGSKRLAQ